MVKKKKNSLKIYKLLSKYANPEDINTFKIASKLGITQQAVAGHIRAAKASNSKIPQKMRRSRMKPASWFGNSQHYNAEHDAPRSNTAENQHISAQSAGNASPNARNTQDTYLGNALPRNYRLAALSGRSTTLSTNTSHAHDSYKGRARAFEREPSLQDQMLSMLEYQMAFDFLADSRRRRALEREEDRLRHELMYRQKQIPEWQTQQIIQYLQAQNQANMYMCLRYTSQMIQEFISGFMHTQQLITSNPQLSNPQQLNDKSHETRPRSITELMQDTYAKERGMSVVRDPRGQFIGYALDYEKVDKRQQRHFITSPRYFQ
jgi:hypothetical protein